MTIDQAAIPVSRTKRTLITASVLAGIVAASWGLWLWTTSMGWSQAIELAESNGLCQSPNCDRAAADAIEILSEGFGTSAPVTQWCLGVISWDETHVRKGGLIKSAAVWLMALPCGSMFATESAVTPI